MIGWDVLPHWYCFSFIANNESCTYWVGTFSTLDLPHLIDIYDAVKWSLDNVGRVIPVVDLSCMYVCDWRCVLWDGNKRLCMQTIFSEG